MKLWDAAADREKRSRTMFAQQTIKVEEVWEELKAVQEATGAGANLEIFVEESLAAYGAIVSRNGVLSIDLKDPEIPEALREIAGNDQLKVCFNPSFKEGAVYLNRTHPMVEGIAGFVMENAFDGETPAVAKRSGVMSTHLVQRRTTLLLVRFRYHIITRINDIEQPLLAEDCQVLGFEGTPSKAEWISPDQIEARLGLLGFACLVAEAVDKFLNMGALGILFGALFSLQVKTHAPGCFKPVITALVER